jgi:hypothetical protein
MLDHREDLVVDRTRVHSRLPWHLHELFPGWAVPPKALRRFHVLDDVEARLDGIASPVPRNAVPFRVATMSCGRSASPEPPADAARHPDRADRTG